MRLRRRAVTSEGKCPFTGDEVVKKSAFMVPMGSFAIANAPFADTKVMVLAAGTECATTLPPGPLRPPRFGRPCFAQRPTDPVPVRA